jgi:lipopolysaccharide transport system permease protein
VAQIGAWPHHRFPYDQRAALRPGLRLTVRQGGMSSVPLRLSRDRGRVLHRFREVWAYRELLLFLTWRDISVRYKQTVLGAGWAVLQPVLVMATFSIFLGRLAKVPSAGMPYPIFVFVGLLPWQIVSYALTNSANSLIANERLVTKIYFPRLVLPLSSVLAGLVDFVLGFLVLVPFMAYYRVWPGPALLLVVPFALLATAVAAAAAIGLSGLNVRYRDVRYVIPFLTQFWLLASPIAYPSSLVPERWRAWYALNPVVAVVEGFRYAVLGGAPPPAAVLLVSGAVTAVGLAAAVRYFLAAERTFADVI